MNELAFYNILISAWILIAVIILVALFYFSAPYGRHFRRGWGVLIPDKPGWVIMELPSAAGMAVLFALGGAPRTAAAWVFLAVWEAHYVHRAFIYPFLRRGRGSPIPLSVAAMGFFFNLVTTYLNGRYLFTLSGGYPAAWILDPRFITGAAVFAIGFIINRWADSVLRSLRRRGETGYRIPRGGLYEWISCPNYFGEIVEWFGWAVMTWSAGGLVFAAWTVANLAPRARDHHNWYRAEFPEYPPRRKALFPGVW
jgi:protein-S-isoprenylcysteine O-methyltransferase Ste14